jgi:hypothetical protein
MSYSIVNNSNPLHQIFIDFIKDELIKLSGSPGLRIKEFGYRQFLSNGTSIGFCTRNLNVVNSKTCCRAEKINSDHLKIKRFYHQETVNNFVIYRRTRNKIEGFYFLSSSQDLEITSYYLSYLEAFEDFINQISLYVNLVLGSIDAGSTGNHRNTNKNINAISSNINIPSKDLDKNSHDNLDNLYVEIFDQKAIE